MIALRLVRLIESHSDELAQGLITRLEISGRTKDLKKVPPEELRSRVHEIFRHLSEWLLTPPRNRHRKSLQDDRRAAIRGAL